MASTNSGLLGVTVSIPGLDLPKSDDPPVLHDHSSSSKVSLDQVKASTLPVNPTVVSLFYCGMKSLKRNV